MAKQSEPPTGDRPTGARTAASSEVASLTMNNVRRGLGAMLIATVMLGVFNSEGLTVYARDLPGNAFSDTLVTMADSWHDLMIDSGLTNVSDVVRETFLYFKEIEW